MLKKRNIFILVLILVLVSFLTSYIFFEGFNYFESCGDGSNLESCSLMKPYYCDSNGILIERASVCGCSENFSIEKESCSSGYYQDSSKESFDYIFNGEQGKVRLELFGGVVDYLDSLPKGMTIFENETYSRIDFKVKKIDQEIQIESLKDLIVEIENSYQDKDFQAKMAVSLIQNIPYVDPKEVEIFGGRFVSQVSRYPYQVLYEDAGWCEGKSELLVLLLRELGFSTAFFYFQENNHEAVGIACPIEYSFRETGYCFIETTVPAMISYSDGPYEDFFQLSEEYELIKFSNGTSLSEDLEDYGDAKTFSRINNKLLETGAMSNYDQLIYENIKEKYGMS